MVGALVDGVLVVGGTLIGGPGLADADGEAAPPAVVAVVLVGGGTQPAAATTTRRAPAPTVHARLLLNRRIWCTFEVARGNTAWFGAALISP